MPFMVPEYTESIEWWKIDTEHDGATYVPRKIFTRGELYGFFEVTDEDISVAKGFGARLSAPGYLDCTEWAVFDTLEEAREYIQEQYNVDPDTGEDLPEE